jgi:preprotein translocase subunit SecG
MENLVLVVHVIAGLVIIGLVLLQHGKGADAGAAFGSGSAGSVFGSSGSANFLSRATAITAVVFFLTSMGLTYLSGRKTDNKGVMAQPPASQEQSLPGQIPPSVPVGKGAPAEKAAPAADPGSKAQDVPK